MGYDWHSGSGCVFLHVFTLHEPSNVLSQTTPGQDSAVQVALLRTEVHSAILHTRFYQHLHAQKEERVNELEERLVGQEQAC